MKPNLDKYAEVSTNTVRCGHLYQSAKYMDSFNQKVKQIANTA